MAGERFSCGPHREISAVCTHPSFRGRGLASAAIRHLVQEHRAASSVSWLHVATTNLNAVRLYQRLGFETHATIQATRLAK
jgi:predicted GNAT family acetyltransferase